MVKAAVGRRRSFGKDLGLPVFLWGGTQSSGRAMPMVLGIARKERSHNILGETGLERWLSSKAQ